MHILANTNSPLSCACTHEVWFAQDKGPWVDSRDLSAMLCFEAGVPEWIMVYNISRFFSAVFDAIRQLFDQILIGCDKERTLMIIDDKAGFGSARLAHIPD